MDLPTRFPLQRVILVTGGVMLGGSTTFLINFAGELVRRRVPVEVISFEQVNPLGEAFEREKISLTCLDERQMIYEDRMQMVLGRIGNFGPTVVVSTLGASSFEVLRFMPKGVFRVAMGQSDDPIAYKTLSYYGRSADLVAVVSERMRQKAAAMPEFAGVRVAYLPLGVPMSTEAESPARDATRPLRILYLGRLAREQKRVHLFPDIFAQLRASGLPFRWTIAGDGPERGLLEAALRQTSANQTVSFAGPVAYAAVPALLREHDIFLLASDYEGLPLSLLEAMGQGLVPVVSQLPSGIPEVVDDTNGLLVPVHDVAGYARAIIHLHEHRDELAAKSAAARARVRQDFSVAAMTDRWLAAFPPPPVVPPAWPQRWKITAPLVAKNPLHFSPPLRVLRRLAVRLRK